MFVYEFMAGTFELITGGEDEETYDPHAKRKVPKPTTYSETMIHLIKGSMGAGILAMPDGVSRAGIVVGVIGIIAIGMFATYCVELLILAQYKLCKRWRRGYMAYDKSMRLAVQAGPKCMRWLSCPLSYGVNIMLLTWQIGVCAIYFVFCAENVKQVLDFYGYNISIRMMILYLFFPQLIMNLVRDLKLLTPISMLSNILIMSGLLLVFFYLVEDDVQFDDTKFKVKSLEGIPVFIGITLFALEAVGVVLALEYNMEKPEQFTGVCGLFAIGMSMIITAFVVFGTCGYLKYGDDAKASLTLNLPQGDKKAQASKLLLAMAMFLSFPLQNFVAYQIIKRKTRKRIKSAKKLWDYFLRIILVVIPFLMAVAAPTLGAAIALVGALCLSLVAVVFPAVMDLCVWYPDQYGFARYKLLRDIFIIIAGLVCLCSGVYTSMIEIVATYN